MYSATINKTHNFTGFYDEDHKSEFPFYDFKYTCSCSCGWAMTYPNGETFDHFSNPEAAFKWYETAHLKNALPV